MLSGTWIPRSSTHRDSTAKTSSLEFKSSNSNRRRMDTDAPAPTNSASWYGASNKRSSKLCCCEVIIPLNDAKQITADANKWPTGIRRRWNRVFFPIPAEVCWPVIQPPVVFRRCESRCVNQGEWEKTNSPILIKSCSLPPNFLNFLFHFLFYLNTSVAQYVIQSSTIPESQANPTESFDQISLMGKRRKWTLVTTQPCFRQLSTPEIGTIWNWNEVNILDILICRVSKIKMMAYDAMMLWCIYTTSIPRNTIVQSYCQTERENESYVYRIVQEIVSLSDCCETGSQASQSGRDERIPPFHRRVSPARSRFWQWAILWLGRSLDDLETSRHRGGFPCYPIPAT